MQKIPTLFKRDYVGECFVSLNRRFVLGLDGGLTPEYPELADTTMWHVESSKKDRFISAFPFSDLVGAVARATVENERMKG